MARPRKHPLEARTAQVRVDLTTAEKAFVQEQAALAGLSEAEFTRRRVLSLPVSAAHEHRRFDPALVNAINRVGVNVNQLALASHVGRDFVQYWREVGAELTAVLEQVVADGS